MNSQSESENAPNRDEKNAESNFKLYHRPNELESISISKKICGLNSQDESENSSKRDERKTHNPLFCIYDCHTCTSPIRYRVEEIGSLSQQDINEELYVHNHRKSLRMPKTKRYRTVTEGKKELIEHYKYAHQKI